MADLSGFLKASDALDFHLSYPGWIVIRQREITNLDAMCARKGWRKIIGVNWLALENKPNAHGVSLKIVPCFS